MENIPDMAYLMRLAQSPAGQQLMEMLQNTDSTALQSAISQACAGDMAGAKNALSALLSDPQTQALLRQMEDAK